MSTTAATMTMPKNRPAMLVTSLDSNFGDRRQRERADDRPEHACPARRTPP